MLFPNHETETNALNTAVLPPAPATTSGGAMSISPTVSPPRDPHVLDAFLPAIEREAAAVRREAAKSATITLTGGVLMALDADDFPRNSCVYRFTPPSPADVGRGLLTPGERVVVIANNGAAIYRGRVRSADGCPAGARSQKAPNANGCAPNHVTDAAFGQGGPQPVVEIVIHGTNRVPVLGTVDIARDSAAWMLDHLHSAITAVLAEPARFQWSREFAAAMLTPEGYRALPVPPPLPEPAEFDWSGQLNQEQLDVIDAVERNALVWVTAAPGTGKTTCVSALLRHMLDRDPDMRVLVVAPSNAAADAAVLALDRVFLEGEHPHGLTTCGLIRRVGGGFTTALDPKRRALYCQGDALARLREETQMALEIGRELVAEAEAAQDATNMLSLREHVADLERDVRAVGERLRANHRITVAPISWVYLNDMYERLDGFDMVVIDECGFADPAAAALVAGFAKHRVVAVGDELQLAPIATSGDRRVQDHLGRSAMEHARVRETVERGEQPGHIIALREQFRMVPPIAALVGDLFYGGTLRTAPARVAAYHRTRTTCWHPLPDAQGARVVVIDTSEIVDDPRFHTPESTLTRAPVFSARRAGDMYGARTTTSRRGHRRARPGQPGRRHATGRSNVAHAALIADLLHEMGHDARTKDADVALLTFYKDQVGLLEEVEASHNRRITSGAASGPHAALAATIHASQGSERSIIVLDAADRRDGPAPVFLQRDGLDICRLLNVALSRAREFVIIIADLTAFAAASPDARRIMQACVEAGCVLRARIHQPAAVARRA